MPQSALGYSIEDLKKKLYAKATVTPRTLAELAERVGLSGYDGRAYGRAAAALVAEGKLQKNPSRKPTYQKVKA